MSELLDKIKDAAVGTLISLVESVGEGKLEKVLQQFHDSSPVEYEATIKAGHAFITPLLKLVAKTETKIDDGLVAALDQAITASALANGITL